MQIINLTPHAILVFDADGKTELLTLPPSGTVARVAVTRKQTDSLDVGLSNPGPGDNWPEIPVYVGTYGSVTDLPEPDESDTAFVVSALVRSAMPNRRDVFSPGELIRGADGQPIGCRGLEANA